jgi:hypothetical protein
MPNNLIVFGIKKTKAPNADSQIWLMSQSSFTGGGHQEKTIDLDLVKVTEKLYYI